MDKAGAYAIQGYAARWIPRASAVATLTLSGCRSPWSRPCLKGLSAERRSQAGRAKSLGQLEHKTNESTDHRRQQVPLPLYSNSRPPIIAASSAVLGTSASSKIDSRCACAPSPTAPIPSRVGIPRAEVKFPSEPPPVAASCKMKTQSGGHGCCSPKKRPCPEFFPSAAGSDPPEISSVHWRSTARRDGSGGQGAARRSLWQCARRTPPRLRRRPRWIACPRQSPLR